MKKSIVFAALFAVIFSASAQEMKVQSAYSDMKNERLAYAKKNIDEALVHEKTKDEAKTWAYAGLIYSQIVQGFNDDKVSKAVKKQLKEIKEPEEEICQKGIEYLKKAIELEKKAGTHENMKNCNEALKFLCGAEALYASKVYNTGNDYEKAVGMWAKVVEDADYVNYKELRDDAMYYQADCYRMLKQKDKEFELYRALAKNDTKKPDVYLKIYQDNKDKGDTTKAINALKKGVKMTANDTTNVNTIMRTELASAYLWAGKADDANKILDDMVAKAGNDVTTLNGVAKIYAEQGNLPKAEEYYNKSLTVDKNQVDALRGLGNAYFNKALKEMKVADAIPFEEVDAYNTKMKEVNAIYEKAIPYFENTLKIKPNDLESLIKLRTVYSVFNARTDVDAATKQGYNAKYQTYNAELQKLTK